MDNYGTHKHPNVKAWLAANHTPFLWTKTPDESSRKPTVKEPLLRSTLEGWTRVGYERGMRFLKGDR